MRVPKIARLDPGAINTGSGSEAFEVLSKGYPVQVLEPGLGPVPPDLFAVVSKWHTWSLGGKNPSRALGKKNWRPPNLETMPNSGEFADFLEGFAEASTDLVSSRFGLPRESLTPDRISWRPGELATTSRRWNARDDLFHVDSFSSRPTHGRRILRLFFNASPTDPLVWTHTANLMEYLKAKGLDNAGFASGKNGPAPGVNWGYDRWLGEIHDRMKKNEEYQEKASRVISRFEPGAVWLALTDCCVHSLLRGEWLMDVTWFVSDSRLTHSQWAPKTWFESSFSGVSPVMENPIKVAA